MSIALLLLILATVSLVVEIIVKRPPYFAVGFVIAAMLLAHLPIR